MDVYMTSWIFGLSVYISERLSWSKLFGHNLGWLLNTFCARNYSNKILEVANQDLKEKAYS